MVEAPKLDNLQALLPDVLRMVTDMSLQSMFELLDDHQDSEKLLFEHFQRISAVTSQISLDAQKMNPRWNKAYGVGGTHWNGALDDGKSRGKVPYYCPHGWVRLSLRVCEDKDFVKRFGHWGILYHGTKGKHVGSILTSGFRASKGLCFCGSSEHAVYFSPSIEYCGHPRYGAIEYNAATKKWTQIVLECRADMNGLWKKCKETLACEEFQKRVDSNIDNSSMEWLFKPNYTDSGGSKFIKDVIVCTGIMIRITDQHPFDMPYWWTQDEEYGRKYGVTTKLQVNPSQTIYTWGAQCEAAGWVRCSCSAFHHTSKQVDGKTSLSAQPFLKNVVAWKSPQPFGNGHMRLAWYLCTTHGMFVVKRYNSDCRSFIEGLGITEEDAIRRDAITYTFANVLAKTWNDAFLEDDEETRRWHINFVQPFSIRLNKELHFGEELIKLNTFIKWNTNTGETNLSSQAKVEHCDMVASVFSHYTWSHTDGQLMVVDLQGWDNNEHGMLFTDPQIHSKLSPKTSFSIGNLGKTGMYRFFASHVCDHNCIKYNLTHPFCTKNKAKAIEDDETRSVASFNSVSSSNSKASFFKRLLRQP